MSAELSDEDIDADLLSDGFDPDDTYAEYGQQSLRIAYRSGYGAALREIGWEG